MRVFFDTSVLVAASVKNHPHHVPAFEALRRAASGIDEAFIGVHSIPETFATLTRLPVQPRIHPSEATRIVRENILRHCALVPAGKAEYMEALTAMKDRGLSGAKIYDALLLAARPARRLREIYTCNLANFRGLASEGLQGRICPP